MGAAGVGLRWYLKADMESPPAEHRIYRRGVGKWYLLSLIAFVLAMLSKGSVFIAYIYREFTRIDANSFDWRRFA